MTAKAANPGGAWSAQVSDFARRIGEAARAQRVVLFGSAARGDMKKDSDLDFLVILPDSMPEDEAGTAWNRAFRSVDEMEAPPMDILVCYEYQARRLRDSPYGPIKFALDEGVELWHDG